jgi:isoleucyl-tRNA synthetase
MEWDRPDQLVWLADQLKIDPSLTVDFSSPKGMIHGSVEQVIGQLGLPSFGGSYFTFSDENNYTIWAALKACFDRGWIYKGHDVMPWCTRCGTGLSQHEIVTEGYRELTHASVTLRFPLVDRPGESLLVWTTTPWTLSSNVAAAVGPELIYVRVRQGDEVFYLSKGALRMLKGEYSVEAEVRGRDMLGWRYRGPFDELPAQAEAGAPGAHRVIAWEEVGEEEGTGIVHIAPGCGAEDFALSKAEALPVIAPLSEDGVFLDGFDWLSGKSVHEVAPLIFADLEAKGLSYRVEDFTHRYPVCWRCGTELVFRLVDEWFISMGAQLEKPYELLTPQERDNNLRYQMIHAVVQETEWHPEFGKDRELDWLYNMHDWMISKKRYWGLALPIWVCDDCGHFEVMGSRGELKARAIKGWAEFDGHTPHRPYVDQVVLACSQCGGESHRIPDVGNPWLDAGVVAMSTLNYNDDREYWSQWFPANLISESFPGQFRNWFYSLLAMSTILERKAPFKACFSYATLLGEDGRAMHKSWGNMIEFNEAADQMGVDVMRWLFCSQKPEKDLLFGYEGAKEVRRQFLIPLWNVYAFFVTYANIDEWHPHKGQGKAEFSELDRWIQARLDETVRGVTDRLEGYQPDLATEELSRFLNDLSNWYLRRSRRRFWAKAGASQASDSDKAAAYQTLYRVLETLIRLLAPFVPFVTEAMYANLVRRVDAGAPESVHHTNWPLPDASKQAPDLTREMGLVMRLVSLGHAARQRASLKVRQPLAEAAFAVSSPDEAAAVHKYDTLIAEELNVERVRLLDTASEVVSFQLHPLPKQLGQKHASAFPAIRQAILALEAPSAAAELLAGRSLTVTAGGHAVEILPEEVEVRVEPQPGFAAAADGAYVAAVDTQVTQELEQKGLAREFVRRVQDLRKEADFEVDARITVVYSSGIDPNLERALKANQAYVAGETLADSLVSADLPSGELVSEAEIDGQAFMLAVSRA